MPRRLRNQGPLVLPPEPDAEALPRFITDRQCEQAHCRWYGPAGARTIREKWGLDWLIVNARAVASSRQFLAEAQRRFDAAPVARSGKSASSQARPEPTQQAA
jgi:hypothetical protein